MIIINSRKTSVSPLLSFSRKRRRDSTRIIYEILLASRSGVSKTRAVHESNLNFHLMKEYLAFLLDKKYLEWTPNGPSFDKLTLTDKGTRLLGLLDQLEGEIKAFRTFGFRRESSDRSSRRPDHRTARPRGTREARGWLRLKEFSRGEQEYQTSLALLRAYSLQGKVSNEIAEIERMLSQAQTLSDNSRLAQTHAWKSNHLTRVGMYQQAILEGQRALDLANLAGNKSKVAAAQIAIFLSSTGIL
jgi:predicted transcriptional regulator